MAEGRFGSLFLTIRTQNLSICAVGEKENLQLKDNLVPKITKFAIKGHCSRFEFTWQGRVHTVAHCGLRRFMAPLFGRSVSPVDPTCTCRCRQTCARFFFYSCFSICHKRRGKSFVVIAYLSTSLRYLLVTQGNEHFGSFLLCEEPSDWWKVVRIIEGPFNYWWGLTFF